MSMILRNKGAFTTAWVASRSTCRETRLLIEHTAPRADTRARERVQAALEHRCALRAVWVSLACLLTDRRRSNVRRTGEQAKMTSVSAHLTETVSRARCSHVSLGYGQSVYSVPITSVRLFALVGLGSWSGGR